MKTQWWFVVFAVAIVARYVFDVDTEAVAIIFGAVVLFIFVNAIGDLEREIKSLEGRVSNAEEECEHLKRMIANI